MKWKVGLCAVVALLAMAGAAQATGLLRHSDPKANEVQAKQEGLEAKLEARGSGEQASALTASGPRGRRGARGPKGATGPRGPAGATGATGATGTFGSITTVTGPSAYLCSWEAGVCAVGSTHVECPAGTTLVGGGFSGAGLVTTVTYDAPSGNGWGIVAVNLDEVPVTALKAVAQCATH
jgi:hypothetical protein